MCHFLAEKPWFEKAMTLINYIYLPKSIQKVNKGVLSLYKGRGRTKRGERTKRGSISQPFTGCWPNINAVYKSCIYSKKWKLGRYSSYCVLCEFYMIHILTEIFWHMGHMLTFKQKLPHKIAKTEIILHSDDITLESYKIEWFWGQH